MVMKSSIGHHGFHSETIGSMSDPVQGAGAPLPPPPSCRKKKYKGVRMRSWGSWVSEIRAPNQKTRIWLGSYSTAEAAARAYDAALICLKGASAATNLNFPITSPFIQIPENASSMSPKSIQRFAAAAAAGEPPAKYAAEVSSSSSSTLFMSSSPQAITSDDAMMLIPTTSSSDADAAAAAAAASWYEYDGFDIGLQSPKYADFMFNGFGYFNVPATVSAAEDLYEAEGEIGLWSFG